MTRHLFRRVGQIDFQSGARKSIDLPRNYLLRRIFLRLSFDMTIGTGSGELAESPYTLIQRLEVVADGKETLKSLPFSSLRAINLFEFSRWSKGQFAAADGSYFANGIINFIMPRSIKPIDTVLDTSRLKTFTLDITWGTLANLLTTVGTSAITNCKLEVYVEEMFGITGQFGLHKQHYMQKDVTASSTNFQFPLAVGNFYKGLLLKAYNNAGLSDAIINQITLQSGTEVFFNAKDEELRGYNISIFDLPENQIDTTGLVIQNLTGYYYVDLCPDGRLVEALDTRALSSLDLILDVTATGTAPKVEVYPIEFIAPPQPAQG